MTITRSTGCASVETVLATAATFTREQAWLEHLRLFPNPGAGRFQLEIRGSAQQILEINLFHQTADKALIFNSFCINKTAPPPLSEVMPF